MLMAMVDGHNNALHAKKHKVKSNLKTLDNCANVRNGGMVTSDKVPHGNAYLRIVGNVNIKIGVRKGC